MLPRPLARLLLAATTLAVASFAHGARADEPPTAVLPTARVHVNSPYGAVPVEMRDAYGIWQPVCYGACDADLPIGFEYRIFGLGDGAADRFVLQAAPGESITVDVTPKVSHKGAMIGLFSAGGGLVLLSGVVALVESVKQEIDTSSDNPNGTPAHPSDPSAYTGAEVLLGLGAAAVVGGIIAAVSGENGTVTQRSATSPEPVRTDDRWRRLPDREAPRHEIGPRATTASFFTATF